MKIQGATNSVGEGTDSISGQNEFLFLLRRVSCLFLWFSWRISVIVGCQSDGKISYVFHHQISSNS